MPRGLIRLAALVFCLAAATAQAEQSETFGDYVVYYAAIRSDELTPEIARTYRITRNRERAVILVNVQKHQTAVSARVTGRLRSLSGREQALVFREVREQNTIDYLAEVGIAHQALAIFDLEVLPPGQHTPFRLQFRNTFYTD